MKPAVAEEKAGRVGVFYLDEKRTGHINALRALVKGVAASGVLHRIDDPGSPVKGLQKRLTDTGEGEIGREADQGEVAAHSETELQDGQDSAPSNPANPVFTGYEGSAGESDLAMRTSSDLRTLPPPRTEDVVAALRARLTHLCGKSQLGPAEQYASVVTVFSR